MRFAFAALLLVLAAAGGVEAKSARCVITDEGRYPCDFMQFGGDGSFVVTAPGRPRYTVQIVDLGVADVFVNFGEREILLPGPFTRSQSDRACWISQATAASICVY